MCCYPGLPPESRIALTLKTLCGFSVKEISRALLTKSLTLKESKAEKELIKRKIEKL
jgi:predicted RNA polymerase sigma factor